MQMQNLTILLFIKWWNCRAFSFNEIVGTNLRPTPTSTCLRYYTGILTKSKEPMKKINAYHHHPI